MMKDLLTLAPSEVTGDAISTEEKLIAGGAWLADMKAALKELTELYQREAVAFMKARGGKPVIIDPENMLLLTEVKTERFATEEIFRLIGITKEQAAFFRPEFKKTPLKPLQEAHPELTLNWQDISEKVEVKPFNKRFLK